MENELPPAKSARLKNPKPKSENDKERSEDENEDIELQCSDPSQIDYDNPYSPLDPESSSCDSDEEEFRTDCRLLPYPIRLIGSAIQTCPELIDAAKQLIENQKGNLELEKRKLMLQIKQLELENAKLALDVKIMEKNMTVEMEANILHHNAQDTRIYLQA